MTQIPGITIKKNAEGRITHVTIDVDQQKELAQPVLEKLGKEKDEIQSTKFRQDFENAMTLEEVSTSAHNVINHLFNADDTRKI